MSYTAVMPSPTQLTNSDLIMGEDYISSEELSNLSDDDLVQIEYRRRNPVESDLNFNGRAGIYDMDDSRIIFAGEDGGLYELPLNTEYPGYLLTDEFELQVYSVVEPEYAD